MLYYIKGDIFDSPAQVLVNTVNTVGVMGKGLALKFKKIYPDMFESYKYFCENKKLDIGKLYLYKTKGKWILNFPTKKNWRNPSRIEYIEKGLKKFTATYKDKEIKSIAFPMLGCGNGGLDFIKDVKPLMDKYLSHLEDINIYVYMEDSTEIIEHKNIKEMKKWLDSNIQNISAIEFKNDIIEYSNGLVVEDEDDSIVINGKGIDYYNILSFWDDLLMNNICDRNQLIDEHFGMLEENTKKILIDVLKRIPYINLNGISYNGTYLIMYQPQRNEKRL